ncbi:hypothetical protein EVAR_8582_1 [Eumeta japonica]|uniref:Uncharacterized protein n=1 Tax=Eumeta variegata TaxID=151549 RepID=A0A4C1TY18_EUMVA|nr:hypothetical protein EVAR_8582_1 [Eumeta japonica]
MSSLVRRDASEQRLVSVVEHGFVVYVLTVRAGDIGALASRQSSGLTCGPCFGLSTGSPGRLALFEQLSLASGLVRMYAYVYSVLH